jgi:hypothetical protein
VDEVGTDESGTAGYEESRHAVQCSGRSRERP